MVDFVVKFFNNLVVDWSQFIPSLISTFVGCVLAIYFSFLYNKLQLCKEKKEIKHHILLELKRIKLTLENEFTTDKYYLEPIKTYYYDSLIKGQRVNLLLAIKTFNLKDEQNNPNMKVTSILGFYATINEFNAWNNWRTNNINSDYVQSANNSIENLKSNALEYIKKMVGES